MNQTPEKDRKQKKEKAGGLREKDRAVQETLLSEEGAPEAEKKARPGERERLREDYEKLKKRYNRMVRRFGAVTGALALLVVLVFISGRMGLLSSQKPVDQATDAQAYPEPVVTTEAGHSAEGENADAGSEAAVTPEGQAAGSTETETAGTTEKDPGTVPGEAAETAEGTEPTGAASPTSGAEPTGAASPTAGAEPTGAVSPTSGPEPTGAAATTPSPAPSGKPDDGQSWFPADHASEQAGSILIEPMEIQMVSAGTVYNPMQVDWENARTYFQAFEIKEGDEVYNRMIGKSLPAEAPVAISDLRYLKMLHFNYSGQVQVGEMVVNAAIAEDVLDAFCSLFEERYEINKMVLIDDYWTGDALTTDDASIADNNTSCFCYRQSIRGSSLSVHASGRGIELNPLENPYVYSENGMRTCRIEASKAYIGGRSGDQPHVITWDDTAVRVFREKGFTWGGEWDEPTVYQVFQKTA